MKKMFILLLTVPMFLVGCGQTANPNGMVKATLSDGTTPVQWSSLTSTTQHAILEVSKHFGDTKPEVSGIFETNTDNSDHQLMYLVYLTGHFTDGHINSQDIKFSILADGTRTWAIRSKSGTSFHDDPLLLN